MKITAKIRSSDYGKVVSVTVNGDNDAAWEFTCLPHQVRTPSRRRWMRARAIAFVRSLVEERRFVYTFPSKKRPGTMIVAGYDSAHEAEFARSTNVWQGQDCSPIRQMSRVEESRLFA